jgi:hypothetical protein
MSESMGKQQHRHVVFGLIDIQRAAKVALK